MSFIDAMSVSIRIDEFDLDDCIESMTEAVATFDLVVPARGQKTVGMTPLGSALATWMSGRQIVTDARLALASARVANVELEKFNSALGHFKAKLELDHDQGLLAVPAFAFRQSFAISQLPCRPKLAQS